MKGWGRNGTLTIAQTEVVLTAGGKTAWVEIFSKKRGKHAPIMITGDTDEVIQWAATLKWNLMNQKLAAAGKEE
jgi:hypothetical protein